MSNASTTIESTKTVGSSDSPHASVIIQLGLTSSEFSAADWVALRKRLSKRMIRPLSEQLGKAKSEPMLWGLPSDQESTDRADMLRRLAKAAVGKKRSIAWAAEALPNWLDEAAGRQPNQAFAIECLAWCHASRELAHKIEGSIWLELMGLLFDTRNDAAGIDLEAAPLLHQLVAGELAISLAYQFADIKPLREHAAKGRKAIAAGITELLDGEGIPPAELWASQRALVACWTRSAAMCRVLKQRLLREETSDGYAWAVQQMLRLTRGDGSQLLDDPNLNLPTDFVRAAVNLADDKECTATAALGGYLGKKAEAKASRYEAPPASSESEWATAAILRTDWSRSATTLAVTHAASTLMMEMCLGADVLFSGNADPHVEIDGKVLPPIDDWEQVCWFSDDEASYLDLEIKLEAGWRLQRQLMLAPTDGFAMLADAILSPADDTEQHTIDYRCELPLGGGTMVRPAEETNEATLIDSTGKTRALVLPLGLPEWQCGPRRGRLSLTDGHGLLLEQSHHGSRLFAPLLIDYYPRRMRKQLTWRHLTVADQLQIQPTDVAVGYRVQIGLEQWLIYRSLAETSNRTVLGHNLTTEFLVGRFDEGEVEVLVEIE